MKTMIEIREATKAQASDIARLIMMAMTDDCCPHFCGVGHGLEDFLKMMTSLVEREDSQYSYRNTLVATARIIPAWTMRHRQVSSTLIR